MGDEHSAENDAPECEPCVSPPGNLCTETGCWDMDRCVAYPPGGSVGGMPRAEWDERMRIEVALAALPDRCWITRCIDEHGGVCREVMCDDSLDVLIDSIVRKRAARAWGEGWSTALEARHLWAKEVDYRPRNPYLTRVTPPVMGGEQ